MAEQIYCVWMNTPLGKRYGTMWADISGETVKGYLEILRHREPFEGTIDSGGNCTVKGVFETLMRRVSYTAAGSITDSRVFLRLLEGRNSYELAGVAKQKGEEMRI